MNEGLVAILLIAGTIAGVLLGARLQSRKDARGMAVAPVGGREMCGSPPRSWRSPLRSSGW